MLFINWKGYYGLKEKGLTSPNVCLERKRDD